MNQGYYNYSLIYFQFQVEKKKKFDHSESKFLIVCRHAVSLIGTATLKVTESEM